MTGKDYPDWGGYPVSGQSYPLKDLAEAVVRLGSPVIYDRSGAVALMESFEFGLGHCEVSQGGGGSLPVLDNTHWNTNGFSALLAIPAGAGHWSMIDMYVPVPPVSLWGVSCRFTKPVAEQTFVMGLVMSDSINDYTASLLYQMDVNRWLYKDASGGTAVLLTNWICPDNDTLFHFVKMVLDPVSHTYVRVIIDDTVIDMSGVPYYLTAPVAYSCIDVSIYLLATGGGASHVNIDDVILTYNESD